MWRLPRLGLRGRVLTLVALAVVPAIALLAFEAFERRGQEADELSRSVLNMARLTAHTQERRLEGARQLLIAISRSSEIRADAPTCTRYVRDLVAQYDGMYTEIGWADTSGRILCHALDGPDFISIGDRFYFNSAKETGKFTVGELMHGRISGAPALAFAQPLREADGTFRGVIFANIDVRAFRRSLRDDWRQEGTTVSILDRHGEILARAPEVERPVGTRASPAQVEIMRQRGEIVREFAGADGVTRVYGIVAVRDAAREPVMFVAVGVRRDVLLAGIDHALRQDLLVFASLGLGILGAAWIAIEWLIRRPLLQLVGATTQLASGRLDTRVGRIAGVPELAALGDAFDDMAEKLEQRDLHLRQSQRLEMIGQLAGGVAHDFNNLLTIIVGYCESLREHVAPGSEASAELSELRTAAERAAKLTHQLLAFGRRQFLQPRALQLNETVATMQSLLERTMGGHIRVETVLEGSLDVVLADPAQIEQVILNLAINARDAMPHGGTLRIETRNVLVEADRDPAASASPPPGGYVMLRVSDTGVGMSAEIRERIFEPFFTTKGAEGTGLGLATVYGVLKQSGGFVYCDSAQGRGTRFTIYLPRTAEAPPEPVRARTPEPSGGSERVILVDDEDGVRSFLEQVLRRSGYSVRATGRAGEALEWIRTGEPADLLVTDVAMPEMSGPKLVEQVRALRPELRVLFISGYVVDPPDGLARPQSAFLQKPFTPYDLLRKVRELLRPEAPGIVANEPA